MRTKSIPAKHIARAIQDLYALIERTNEQIAQHQTIAIADSLTLNSLRKQKKQFTTQLLELFSHLNLDVEIHAK